MHPGLDELIAAAPHVADLAERHGAWLSQAGGDPDAALRAELETLAAAGREAGEEEVSRALRLGKARVALLAAVAEVTGQWTTRQATRALSDLADAALDAGLAVLLRRSAERGRIRPEAATPARSGLMLFGLGKHGGRELNYSSDLDIVAFYDPGRGALTDPEAGPQVYTRLVQRLAAMIGDRTDAGYVFRVDLRLRPDPGATPVAISLDAALAYYESRGQNWERAAWIKGRACAGDIEAGQAFLDHLAPYVWRKHLDFAMIADIQAMKRQINIARKVGEARALGHNVKLGRGGIREIEFFAQTQQLIAGGRDPALRVRPTEQALAALAQAGWITRAAADELTRTYWYLRAVENRLQMLRDEQTHTMPETEEGLAVIARLMGAADLDAFVAEYRAALASVQHHYAELFADNETLSAGEGDLVFTGSDDDPATLETLAALGFKDPARASATIRKWHYGGYAATRTGAARAHLTELMPALLSSIAEAGNADATLARFDNFLSRLPAGVQLFALLRTHERLRALLIALLASAPRMADAVIHRAHVMDGLIDPAFDDEVSQVPAMVEKVETFLGEARDYQDVIDRARIIGQEQVFLIAAGFLSGTITAERAGQQFTAVAETLLGRLFASVSDEFAQRYGRVPGARAGLLAFGKMASREMTATSDLDFILLYDAEGADEASDGARQLDIRTYYTRLTQRLVAAVTAPTAEGVLYKADMRLRPSGNAGPLATTLAGFLAYQQEQAWTWEHLALSRARAIFGEGDMDARIATAIGDVLAAPRDADKTISDVVAMRERLARDKPPRHAYDLKLAAGGLVDLEFIAQSGQLLARSTIDVPQATTTAAVLARMGETGLVPEGERLVEIHATFSTVLQAMSAALTDPLRREDWTEAFHELLARLTHYPTFERLDADLKAMQAEVVAIAARWYETARRF